MIASLQSERVTHSFIHCASDLTYLTYLHSFTHSQTDPQKERRGEGTNEVNKGTNKGTKEQQTKERRNDERKKESLVDLPALPLSACLSLSASAFLPFSLPTNPRTTDHGPTDPRTHGPTLIASLPRALRPQVSGTHSLTHAHTHLLIAFLFAFFAFLLTCSLVCLLAWLLTCLFACSFRSLLDHLLTLYTFVFEDGLGWLLLCCVSCVSCVVLGAVPLCDVLCCRVFASSLRRLCVVVASLSLLVRS